MMSVDGRGGCPCAIWPRPAALDLRQHSRVQLWISSLAPRSSRKRKHQGASVRIGRRSGRSKGDNTGPREAPGRGNRFSQRAAARPLEGYRLWAAADPVWPKQAVAGREADAPWPRLEPGGLRSCRCPPAVPWRAGQRMLPDLLTAVPKSPSPAGMVPPGAAQCQARGLRASRS